MIGGTRPVNPCQGPSVNYEIATSRVVSHEVGHALGLVHTFENSGDDGLSDTPVDYIDGHPDRDQDCINASNCQFSGSCANCSLNSNPGTNMINFMSYTVPPCMSYFSPLQLDLMRSSLNSSMASVVSHSFDTPELTNIKYDNYNLAYTVNGVSVGGHTIQTNEDPSLLTQDINWVSTSSIWWGVSGYKNVNAWFNLSAGQSTTFKITATNICGSSLRNISFFAYSGYRIYSSGSIKDKLTIEFDKSEYPEAYPSSIKIFDEKSGKEQLQINVQELAQNNRLVDGIKVVSDVSRLSRGTKILHFYYDKIHQQADGKPTTETEIKTERIILVDQAQN